MNFKFWIFFIDVNEEISIGSIDVVYVCYVKNDDLSLFVFC